MNETIEILRAQGWDEELLKALANAVDFTPVNSSVMDEHKAGPVDFGQASTEGVQFNLSGNLVAR